MNASRHESRPTQWSIEFNAFARACGGAILFGIPLLFTMEMWWIGVHQARPQLVGLVGLAFVANTALARLSGFREEDRGWSTDLAQAAEAMAVAIVLSLVTLTTLDRIDARTSVDAIAGMVAVQVLPLSLGAIVGNIVFDGNGGRAGEGSDERRPPLHELANDVGATFVGATFIGFALAPTEEIPMIATGLHFANVLAIVLLSLFAAYVIVFASGFDRSHHDRHVGGLFQGPFSETMLSYVVSLAAAFLLLIVFGHIALDTPIHSMLREVLVLGIPAAIGGAGGRAVV